MKPIAEDFQSIAAELKRIEDEKARILALPEGEPNNGWVPAAGYYKEYDPACSPGGFNDAARAFMASAVTERS